MKPAANAGLGLEIPFDCRNPQHVVSSATAPAPQALGLGDALVGTRSVHLDASAAQGMGQQRSFVSLGLQQRVI